MGNDFPRSRQGLGNVRQPGPPNPLKGGFSRGEASFSPYQGVGGSCGATKRFQLAVATLESFRGPTFQRPARDLETSVRLDSQTP